MKLVTPLLAAVLLFTVALPAQAERSTPPTPSSTHHYFLPLAQTNPSVRRGHGLSYPGQLQTYVLKPGDNLADLALELGRDVAIMACVTPSASYPLSELRPGQTIVLPSARYACHTVQEDETLAQIAAHYGVNVNVIVETPWNELESAKEPLKIGQRLLIYGGQRPAADQARIIPRQPASPPEPKQPPPTPTVAPATPAADAAPPEEAAQPAAPIWPYGDGHFIWPVEGVISQGFKDDHRALDIAADFGKPVLAADNGVVKKAGWSDVGYGLRVVIDHNIDYVTLYAHLSDILVEEGQVVEKGQVIGYIGSTGNSTGPHLHFELRDFGYLIDPRDLLGRGQ